jgi:hypothetical protein
MLLFANRKSLFNGLMGLFDSMPPKLLSLRRKIKTGDDDFLRRRGLKLRVVDKPGGVWEKAHTFRSGEQENLLIADNQTLIYQAASPTERVRMSDTTWKNKCQD